MAVRVVDVIADLRVDDVHAARRFYADYLGLSTEEFNLGWVARFTSPDSGAHLQVVTRDAAAGMRSLASRKARSRSSASARSTTWRWASTRWPRSPTARASRSRAA